MLSFPNKYFLPALIKKIKADFFIYKLTKNLPKDYKFRFLSDYPEYKEALKDLCFSIIKSNESNCLNYSEKKIPYK